MSIAIAIKLFLTTLFARTLWHKLSDLKRTDAEIAAYQLLPAATVRPVSLLLCLLELCCVGGLLWYLPALWLAAVLLCVYCLAMAINLWRGNRHIDCGCGGWLNNTQPLSWWLVGRNSCLIALAIAAWGISLFEQQQFSTLTTYEPGLVMLIAFTCWVLYEAFDQTLINHHNFTAWKNNQQNQQSTQPTVQEHQP